MIHSLLSSLPNLVDDEDIVDAETIKAENEPPPWIKEEEFIATHDNAFLKEDGELNISTADPLPQLEGDAKDGETLDNFPDGVNVPSDDRCGHTLMLADEQENLPGAHGADTIAPIVDGPPSDLTGKPPSSDQSPSPKRSSSNLEIPSEDTSRGVDLIKVEKSETPPPTLPAHPPLAKLVLTDLLKLADDLYDKYPPSHSMLALSSIMGPQSVVFTWSESLSALPSDNTAEAMVSHPELVVYPYIEVNPYQKETDMEEKQGRSKIALRKRRKKLRKLPFGQVEKKTVLAGTVIVLGVAVAIYGIKARNGPGSHGLFQAFADGHRAHGGTRDWKRIGGWVGGTLVGVSQKIINGLSSDS